MMSGPFDLEPLAVPLPEAPPDNPFAEFHVPPRPVHEPLLRWVTAFFALLAALGLGLTGMIALSAWMHNQSAQVVRLGVPAEVPPPPDSTDPLPELEFRGHGADLLAIHRRDRRSEAELRRELQGVPELVFTRGTPAHRILRERRFDLVGLAVNDDNCRLEPGAAVHLANMASRMRGYLGTTYRSVDKEANLRYLLEQDPIFHTPEAVTCLMQMLQPESRPIRLALVAQLARIEGPRAGEALARLAIFDLSGLVRTEAIVALAGRPGHEGREVFLAALSHPWPAAADHAAEALVALKDEFAVPELERLAELGSDSPGESQVRELVRLNHLKNCAFCHVDSRGNEPLNALVPSPSQPLPSINEYYRQQDGPFVNAAVTFLRQDFSQALPVANPEPWPERQRFDFLIRTRDRLPGEAVPPIPTPQREAVRFALERLLAMGGK